MEKYSIKRQQTDWRPLEIPKVLRNFDRIRWNCVPTESMEFDYIDPETGKLDEDWRYWKKVGGVKLINLSSIWKILRRKPLDAILFATRWNPLQKVHEFCIYVNMDGENIPYEKPIQVLRSLSGTTASYEIVKGDNNTFSVYLFDAQRGIDSVNRIIIRLDKSYFMYITSGLYYGGKNNSPGPFGGAAPKDMTIFVDRVID